MAIRQLNGNRFNKRDRHGATVSTLPTVKAMVNCFENYLNLTIADGHASVDTVKTYRNRVHQFLCWCRERELYPVLITQENIKEYRKHSVDGEKPSGTIRLSLLAVKHFYTACLAEKLVKNNNPATLTHYKTRQDSLNLVTNFGIYDKSCISEERSEGKLSRFVLQKSRRGDSLA